MEETKVCVCGVDCEFCAGSEEAECTCSDNACDCQKCAAHKPS